MNYKLLNTIDSPADLKKLPISELPHLCEELRDFIIRSCAKNPGHLASSLGAIELTVALHYVMDTPNDKLVWDVGHQAYAHKILTGRRDTFHTNRTLHGVAPFPSPLESPYDAFIAGHASNSISAALGMAVSSELDDDTPAKRRVVAIIGDGALTGGLAYEGLNNASMVKSNLLIVLNDNNMAIDPIRGGITQYLLDLTTSGRYNRIRYNIYLLARKLGLMNDEKKGKVQRFHNNIKAILSKQKTNLFSGLNIRYFGPADGHDVISLVRILNEIKDYRGPKVLHLITQKGKGFAPAEENQTVWHAPGKFDPETGERLKPQTTLLWQQVFGETLLNLSQNNPNIVAITPAMPTGSSLTIMQKVYPERVFDCGIAEEHAVTFSAGLASVGKIPFCAIYSSFLQRAYDQIIHDVAITRQHVIFAIDRAGIVGQDGATHHGLFDIVSLLPIPNLTVLAPMDSDELQRMLAWAVTADGPIAIRYPRGTIPEKTAQPLLTSNDMLQPRLLQSGKKAAFLSFGAIGNHVADALHNLDVAHYDVRAAKPLSASLLSEVFAQYPLIFTAEDGLLQGGFGSAILAEAAQRNYNGKIICMGIDNQFVEHGKPDELYALLHLDADSIRHKVEQYL